MTPREAQDVAIVGVGASPYYERGASAPRSPLDLACEAIIAACADAGLSPSAIDGFANYSAASAAYGERPDPVELMETLGIDDIGFTATLTGGGGGSAGAIGLARAAIGAGDATCVCTVMVVQQAGHRLGSAFAEQQPGPMDSFVQPSGLIGPGHRAALLARRHMFEFGTTRAAFAEIAVSTRLNAGNRPKALRRTPLTVDRYLESRMVADPLCVYDFCLESDGAVAVLTTSAERARDLRQRPVPVLAVAHGGDRAWGRAFDWFGMPEGAFTSAGNVPIARRIYAESGLSAGDVDVALLYDHFSPMVLMQLEDYGFCQRGEGGAFVESGAIRLRGGSIPVNTHGGHLSEAYVAGMTHIVEGVEQLRGVAVNQVDEAEVALVTGGPSALPVSGLLLGRG